MKTSLLLLLFFIPITACKQAGAADGKNGWTRVRQNDQWTWVDQKGRVVVRAFEAISKADAEAAGRRLKPGISRNISSVCFSPDGKSFLSSAVYGKTILWSVPDGQIIRQFSAKGTVSFSPDGQEILIGTQLFDKRTGKLLHRFRTDAYGYEPCVFSSDGHVALIDEDSLFVWSKQPYLSLRKTSVPKCWALAFSNDGKEIATGTAEGLVQIWSTEHLKELDRFEIPGKWISALAFSPDGRELLLGSEYEASLWSRDTKATIFQLGGHQHLVKAVAFSPDGKWMLSGCLDTVIRLWSHETGEESRRFDVPECRFFCAGFSPDGRYILSGGSDGMVRLWDWGMR